MKLTSIKNTKVRLNNLKNYLLFNKLQLLSPKSYFTDFIYYHEESYSKSDFIHKLIHNVKIYLPVEKFVHNTFFSTPQ